MTDDTPRLRYVQDHLTGVQIPVRYIEPGTETVLDDWATLEALARSVQAVDEEFEAECDGELPASDLVHRDMLWERWHLALDAIEAQVAHLTIPPAGMTSTPMRTLLAEVCG